MEVIQDFSAGFTLPCGSHLPHTPSRFLDQFRVIGDSIHSSRPPPSQDHPCTHPFPTHPSYPSHTGSHIPRFPCTLPHTTAFRGFRPRLERTLFQAPLAVDRVRYALCRGTGTLALSSHPRLRHPHPHPPPPPPPVHMDMPQVPFRVSSYRLTPRRGRSGDNIATIRAALHPALPRLACLPAPALPRTTNRCLPHTAAFGSFAPVGCPLAQVAAPPHAARPRTTPATRHTTPAHTLPHTYPALHRRATSSFSRVGCLCCPRLLPRLYSFPPHLEQVTGTGVLLLWVAPALPPQPGPYFPLPNLNYPRQVTYNRTGSSRCDSGARTAYLPVLPRAIFMDSWRASTHAYHSAVAAGNALRLLCAGLLACLLFRFCCSILALPSLPATYIGFLPVGFMGWSYKFLKSGPPWDHSPLTPGLRHLLGCAPAAAPGGPGLPARSSDAGATFHRTTRSQFWDSVGVGTTMHIHLLNSETNPWEVLEEEDQMEVGWRIISSEVQQLGCPISPHWGCPPPHHIHTRFGTPPHTHTLTCRSWPVQHHPTPRWDPNLPMLHTRTPAPRSDTHLHTHTHPPRATPTLHTLGHPHTPHTYTHPHTLPSAHTRPHTRQWDTLFHCIPP